MKVVLTQVQHFSEAPGPNQPKGYYGVGATINVFKENGRRMIEAGEAVAAPKDPEAAEATGKAKKQGAENKE